MKLNIGCGYKHLRGFLNVDSDMDSLADSAMEAYDLQLASSSVDEIFATQLIEHLGFFKSKFFLSECFRVLQPGGILTLDTPDIDRTFEVFIAGDRMAREASLSWVYGSETLGMQHKFCFPVELLREVAAEIGFLTQDEELFMYEQYRPAVRLILRKPPNAPRKELFAQLRRNLLNKNIPKFEDEFTIACQEEVLQLLASPRQDDRQSLLRLAVHSAEIVREYFRLEAETLPAASRYESIAAYLAEYHLQDHLLEMLEVNRAGAGCQDFAYRQTLERGVMIINDLAEGKNMELPSNIERRVDVFLTSIIRAIADKTFARGLKEFNLEHYQNAIDLFHASTAIFRNNPFPYWNAARTHKLMGNTDLARQCYNRARTAMEFCPHETRKYHREALADEMRAAGI